MTRLLQRFCDDERNGLTLMIDPVVLQDVEALAHIRIVAVTGSHTDENVARIIEAGANICLPKPFEPEALLAALNLTR